MRALALEPTAGVVVPDLPPPAPSTTEAPGLREPEAPRPVVGRTAHLAAATPEARAAIVGAAMGRLRRALIGTLLGATVLTGCATQGGLQTGTTGVPCTDPARSAAFAAQIGRIVEGATGLNQGAQGALPTLFALGAASASQDACAAEREAKLRPIRDGIAQINGALLGRAFPATDPGSADDVTIPVEVRRLIEAAAELIKTADGDGMKLQLRIVGHGQIPGYLPAQNHLVGKDRAIAVARLLVDIPSTTSTSPIPGGRLGLPVSAIAEISGAPHGNHLELELVVPAATTGQQPLVIDLSDLFGGRRGNGSPVIQPPGQVPNGSVPGRNPPRQPGPGRNPPRTTPGPGNTGWR